MTHPTDVARGRDIVARWCELAEQRLDYLTELFETGRWRRFHSERDFLENVREAKSAVETWRSMLDSEGFAGQSADRPVLDRQAQLGSAGEALVPPEPSAPPQVSELPVAPSVSVVPAMAEPEPVLALDPVAEESALDKTLALTLDIVAMQERYPLLRNAL